MKKIILVAVNTKYIHTNLALYSLKQYAEQYMKHTAGIDLKDTEGRCRGKGESEPSGEGAIEIEIAEYTINQYISEIIRDIVRKKPAMLAFSCYIWNREYVGKLIQDIRKIMPDMPVWVGGPEAFYDTNRFMEEYTGTTGIMVGEGEEIFKELVLYYQKADFLTQQKPEDIHGRDLRDIKGIVYRNPAGELVTNERQELLDMNTIPFPYDDICKLEHKILYYESSRGCPFSCSYCLSSVEKTLRFRELERVKEDLDIFLKYQVPQVKFVDRTFNCNKKHAMEIWRYILEHNNGVTNFHFEIAADLIDEETLELLSLMPAGLIQLEIGVQSVNSGTIEEIKRRMDLGDVKKVVERIRGFGTIHQHLDLIAGLPYEDYLSFQHSFNEVYAMKPQQLQLGFLKVLKGTDMEMQAAEYELVYSQYPPYEVSSTKWISYEELLLLKSVENMVEIYYNSAQFSNILAYMERYFKHAFAMYQELGNFYERKSGVGEKHSRIARYELLLTFLKWYLKEELRLEGETLEAEVRICLELVVYDVYLRENIKTRPEYFPETDTAGYRDIYRQSKKEGRQIHIEHFQYDVKSFSEGVWKGQTEIILEGPKKQEVDIIFDYQKRNVVDYAARTERIETGDNEKG